jgi:hypothetical protein
MFISIPKNEHGKSIKLILKLRTTRCGVFTPFSEKLQSLCQLKLRIIETIKYNTAAF